MWDGLLECSLALEMVPAEARLQIAGQRAGIIPWVGSRDGGKGSEMNIRATCTYFKTSRSVAQRSLQEQTTHGMPCKRKQAWHIFGPQMTVISCATRRWLFSCIAVDRHSQH